MVGLQLQPSIPFRRLACRDRVNLVASFGCLMTCLLQVGGWTPTGIGLLGAMDKWGSLEEAARFLREGSLSVVEKVGSKLLYLWYCTVYVEGECGELQLKSPTTKSPGSTWFFILSLQGGKNKASQSALFRASALGLESLCLLASGATSFSTFRQRFCSLQVRKLCSVWFIHVHTLDGRRRVHTLRPFGCWLFHSLLVLSLSFGFGWFGCFAFGVRVQDFLYQAVV